MFLANGFENMGGLVEYLVATNVLKTTNVTEAFREIDRADFVLPEYIKYAYFDEALPIGYSQTISQPTTVAIMLELLQPERNHKILDVGSGSGWTTALLGYIVGNGGSVLGLEKVLELVKFGRQNLAKYNFTQASILQAGDQLGIPGQQFDRILVSAAAHEVPNQLIDQIKSEGKMVIPIENSIFLIEKDFNNKVQQKEIPGFVFVPLIS